MRPCVVRMVSWAMFGALVMVAVSVAMPRWLPARSLMADVVCPSTKPVFVSAHQRAGVAVRAHCRR